MKNQTLINRKQLHEIIPLCAKTVYLMEKKGQFPKRIALSPRRVAWVLEEVNEWIAQRQRGVAEKPACFVR